MESSNSCPPFLILTKIVLKYSRKPKLLEKRRQLNAYQHTEITNLHIYKQKTEDIVEKMSTYKRANLN